LFLTGLFRTLPDAVLAAVVLVAVKGLIDVGELRHLWRVSKLDFGAAAVALGGVLLMGVLDGVLVAVLASVVMLLGRSSRPHVAFLGRIPGTNRFSDLARHPDNEPIPGILVFRVQSSLLYFNVDHVLEVVRRSAKAQAGLRRVIYGPNVPYVDVAGGRMLRRMNEEFMAQNVEFKIADAHGPARHAEGGRTEDRVGALLVTAAWRVGRRALWSVAKSGRGKRLKSPFNVVMGDNRMAAVELQDLTIQARHNLYSGDAVGRRSSWPLSARLLVPGGERTNRQPNKDEANHRKVVGRRSAFCLVAPRLAGPCAPDGTIRYFGSGCTLHAIRLAAGYSTSLAASFVADC
jgi:MFS superfamily sulfate permease-like transporter